MVLAIRVRYLSLVLLLLAVLMAAQTGSAEPKVLRVVSDDNYPPYIFRDKSGALVGIIVDQWRLWEKTTGVRVELHACNWTEALQRMHDREFDVIDTLFFSEDRARFYDFLDPYADIDVPLFFHKDLSAIRNAEDAVGFAVGAKAGDNVIAILKKAGVNTIVEYPSYEAVMRAAADGACKVFSVDRPPAFYYLNRMGVVDQFRETEPLYRGQFHRAVHKGNAEIAGLVQMGFNAIPKADLDAINDSWLGKMLHQNSSQHFWRLLFYGGFVAAIVILFLGVWLGMLRRMVSLRTSELLSANESLKKEISERQKAEEEKELLQNQLQQAMKMEAVGRLAGGVAHDFNNLLTAIIGNVSLASIDLPADSRVVGNLNEIEKAARSAALLTQQLLAFSRRQNIEPKVLNINEIIANLYKMLCSMAGERIELQLLTARDLGNVMLDPGQFERILINLVLNARDAMPDGGIIRMTTVNIVLSEAECSRWPDVKPGDYVRLTFSDNGVGMSEEVVDHLFEPFFTTKPRGRGTGLGLSAIYGIIRQAGGFINVSSTPGKGTIFEICMPVTMRPIEREAAPSEKVEGGNETVLLVEDEDIVRFIGAEILKKLGYNLIEAANGREALEIFKKHGSIIDLMLTDLMMPGMTGRELAEKVREISPRTRILFTSACTDDVIDGQEIADQGLNFIAKPFSLESLAIKIRSVLSRP
ncbi:hypothetical protein MASR1M12_12190 [Erysipelotrichia bacterium]